MFNDTDFQAFSKVYDQAYRWARSYPDSKFTQEYTTKRDEVVKTLLTFVDRPTYFAWRSIWQTRYKRLSADIRAAKQKRKTVWNGYVPELYGMQADARAYLHLRAESKKLSWQQKQQRVSPTNV